ncbi:hypothetical protein CWI42_110400 [Ordospora colligata]|uniref:Uncharacterized protein n=1 Tax=Ordospora colligata OC4 TaxID=1354746 RepID=A0A0B2UJ47_9MICR|nr:uncharacterized protein M896_110400 [Ordospora colligata OC4]KHN69010.1 hypothetical protein M896_110400 [Ordospora colligata OC4]TBU14238.1 hypothetical protein CWI40_110400 [Ordospora colligata]TBU14285.1 hypothetical protein CWI41_110400 [Ordospora colligata]TBU17915.1 hypothetical protein CWI42_110400 [Ordospora colligata]
MMMNWTTAFIVLRSMKICRIRKNVQVILDYLRLQQYGMKCSLCDFDLNTQGLLCKRCFKRLHPMHLSLKTSIVVEYAHLMHTIEKYNGSTEMNTSIDSANEIDIKRFRFLGVSIDCTTKDFQKLFLNIAFTNLTHTEELILQNIRIKIHRCAINRWKTYKYNSIINALDVHYNTVKLNHLICIKNLRTEDAWILKKHLLEVQKYKDDLIEINKANNLNK